MSELVEATLGAIRRIASDLRPVILDDLGLKAAVEWLAHDFRKRNPHIQCQLALELQEAERERDKSSHHGEINREDSGRGGMSWGWE